MSDTITKSERLLIDTVGGRVRRTLTSSGGVFRFPGIFGGGVPPGSLNPNRISDLKNVYFHTRFQTQPLKSKPVFNPCIGRNSRLRKQRD